MTSSIRHEIDVIYSKLDSDFATDLEVCKKKGYVFEGEDYFIMGWDERGRWFIQLAVGNIDRLRECLPYWLPYIGWARSAKGRTKIVWHATEKVLRLINAKRKDRRWQAVEVTQVHN